MKNKSLVTLFINVGLILVVVSLCLVSACSTNAPAPTSAAAPSKAAPPGSSPAAAAANAVILKLGTDAAPTSYFSLGADWWAKEVTKQTEGRVVVQTYFAGSLAKMTTVMDSFNTGLVDLYTLSVASLQSFFPISQVVTLPGLSFPETLEGKMASSDNFMGLFNKYPSISEEWKGIKILYPIPGPTFHILSKSKEIHAPADIVGMKIGAQGMRLDLVKSAGAAPVSLAPPDIYQNMQTGVIDGGLMDWSAINDFQLFEVGKVFLEADIGESRLVLVISQNSWNKIQARDQQIILDISKQGSKVNTEYLVNGQATGKQKFANAGGKVIVPTANERTQWQSKSQVIWDSWLSQQGAKSKDAKELLDARKSASDAAWATAK